MYEENEELTHDQTTLSEKFDEWSGREVTYTQLGNKKSDIEKELKNNIENMGNKEYLKGISRKEDLKGMQKRGSQGNFQRRGSSENGQGDGQ